MLLVSYCSGFCSKHKCTIWRSISEDWVECGDGFRVTAESSTAIGVTTPRQSSTKSTSNKNTQSALLFYCVNFVQCCTTLTRNWNVWTSDIIQSRERCTFKNNDLWCTINFEPFSCCLSSVLQVTLVVPRLNTVKSHILHEEGLDQAFHTSLILEVLVLLILWLELHFIIPALHFLGARSCIAVGIRVSLSGFIVLLLSSRNDLNK